MWRRFDASVGKLILCDGNRGAVGARAGFMERRDGQVVLRSYLDPSNGRPLLRDARLEGELCTIVAAAALDPR